MFSGGFRGGSRGSLEPTSGPTLFRFHGEFQKILCEIRQTNPPFLHLNPLFRNPGSAPDVRLFSYPKIFIAEQSGLCYSVLFKQEGRISNLSVVHMSI